jgi:hypothetical protein
LVGEGGGETNLFLCKRANLVTGQDNYADRAAFAQERNAENGPVAADSLCVAVSEARVRKNVGAMDDAALK